MKRCTRCESLYRWGGRSVCGDCQREAREGRFGKRPPVRIVPKAKAKPAELVHVTVGLTPRQLVKLDRVTEYSREPINSRADALRYLVDRL